MSSTDDAPLFALSEEHRAIREAVRALCEAKVAPYAADVDEQARYPEEAAAALLAADFHAPHVPEEYGGAGADALATVLVIEEIARVDMSASLIPAVNKLGSLPVQLAGSEELKKHYLGALARGEGGFSYCLSEPDAGSDAVGDEDPGGPRRRPLGAQRREAVDHQRRSLGLLHGHGRHRPGEARAGASRRSWSRSPTRASPSAPPRRSSASRARRPARSTSTTSGSPPTG